MAEVSELTKLSRPQLEEFAAQNGVEDASSTEKYPTKKDLAQAFAGATTPEALASFIEGQKSQGSEEDSEEATRTEPKPVPPTDSEIAHPR